MKIGYISPTDPHEDKKAWSGTYFSVCKAIEQAGHEVVWMNYQDNSSINKILYFIGKILYRIRNGRGSFNYSDVSGKIKTSRMNNKYSNVDVIFSPAQPDIVANLKTDKPIIFYNDGTVPLMVDYYWFGYSPKAVQKAIRLEKRASKRVSAALYSSKWSADSAVHDYGVESQKVHVFPFGANLDESAIKHSKPYLGEGELRILFSGVDWDRKGGTIAVDTVRILNERGVNAKLTICGTRHIEDEIKEKPYIDYVGFLNKNVEGDYKKYLSIWENTHLFLLPTRAECSATVLNEASAYGVPTLTTDTGGLADYVVNGINGERLSLDASAEEYAEKIIQWINEKLFCELSEGAKKIYEESNCWRAWGVRFNKVISYLFC